MAGLECTARGCLLSRYAHCTHQSEIWKDDQEFDQELSEEIQDQAGTQRG